MEKLAYFSHDTKNYRFSRIEAVVEGTGAIILNLMQKHTEKDIVVACLIKKAQCDYNLLIHNIYNDFISDKAIYYIQGVSVNQNDLKLKSLQVCSYLRKSDSD